jgi:hypothetical protein
MYPRPDALATIASIGQQFDGRLLMRLCIHMAIFGLAGLIAGSANATASERQLIAVEVEGSLQGAANDELPAIITSEMEQAPHPAWQFAPATGATAPNRIEWKLVPASDASGAVRTFGFSRGMMTRLEGAKRVVSVEVRLYLNGKYQTMAVGQIRDTGNPRDAEVADEIATLTRQVLADAAVHATNTAQTPTRF